MRIAYLDCFSGISGDMTIAAFIDAGLKLSALSHELKKLNIGGYRLEKSRVRRGEIYGTKFNCIKTRKYRGHRSLGSITALIDKSSLSMHVKTIAKDIFDNIGRAEAKIHRVGRDKDVWLHELGDIDSIIDIVGVAVALDLLGIDEVYASTINMGRTVAKTAHGVLPMPGPAVLELLRGVSVKIIDVDAELVTPTGAGILKTLSRGFGEMPLLSISDIGYGAGSKEICSFPNMLRVIIGESAASFKADAVVVIETNIDDMNPQCVEYVFEKLFSMGALDVFSTAIQTKKGRSALKLTVICERMDIRKMSSVIFSETTSIGVRFHEVERFKLKRKIVKTKTEYGEVPVKISSGPDGVMTISPEYDDCRKIARSKNIPLRIVLDKAKEAAHGIL